MSKNKNYMDYYKKPTSEEINSAEPVQGLRSKINPVDELLSDDIHEDVISQEPEEKEEAIPEPKPEYSKHEDVIPQEPEEKEEAISEPKPGYSKYAVVVNAKKVNFRKTPDGDILKVLPLGTKVKLIDYGKDWCSVEFDGASGFMMTKFLKEVL